MWSIPDGNDRNLTHAQQAASKLSRQDSDSWPGHVPRFYQYPGHQVADWQWYYVQNFDLRYRACQQRRRSADIVGELAAQASAPEESSH